jgi:predicted N-acyltransferase
MPDGSEALTVRTVDRIGAVDAAAWDRCAGGVNPFVSHAFLRLLEETGCVSKKSGWLPQHVLLEDSAGRLLGAAPAYLKSHSYGEYVFDHGWADAYERAGGRYYPKLQVAVPFTPVPGPRLLAPPGPDQKRHRLALLTGLIEVARALEVSSVHITYVAPEEAALAEDAGLLMRHGCQYHWFNRGYQSFDDFLGALASRKRKQIKKERDQVRASGIEVRPVHGGEMKPRDWDAFFKFYVDTYDRKWGYPYLTREFFGRLGKELGDAVVMMLASRNGATIAGALNLRGSDALFGRNWGAAGDFPFLHFEACYYQAIDYAIAMKLARVEAGTQGPHKVQRGYEPVRTFSAHWIPDRRFKSAVAQFLERERLAIAQDMEAMAAHTPFRCAEGTES